MATPDDVAETVNSNSHIANNIYKYFSKKHKENVLFSPISIHSTLAMAYQAASGETADKFAATLNVSSKETIANGYKNIVSAVNNVDKGVALHMASKIFVRHDVPIKSTFADVLAQSFLSEAESINFSSSKKAAKIINKWAEEKTNSKIKDIIDPKDLKSTTALILINAIYFNGSWLDPFDKKHTTSKPFYISHNRRIYCSMMWIKSHFQFCEDVALDAKILKMNYRFESLSMVFILPNAKDGITNLESKLADVDLSTITKNVEVNPCGAVVSIPKFRIESTLNLEPTLTEMGLGIIFGNTADFSQLTETHEKLYVSKIIQKAFLEVNEEGTEAAADTVMLLLW